MIKLMRYHQQKPAASSKRSVLVKEGRKWLQVVAMDATKTGGMTVWRVPRDDLRYMEPLLRKGKPYPMSRALTVFRRFAKSHGATKAAMKIIREAGSG